MNRRRNDDPDTFDGTGLRNNERRAILHDAPWWVRLLFASGIPPVALLVGFAVYAGWIQLPNQSRVAAMIQANDEFHRQHDQKTEGLIRRVTSALRIICENQAQTAEQRRNCAFIE